MNPKQPFKTALKATLAAALLASGCSALQPQPFGNAQGLQPVAPVGLNRFAAPANVRAASNSTNLRSTGRVWQDEVIYFVFTDRFANGDRSNDFNVQNNPWAYHGGDLQGVINKLDYIKDLGATAIWLTPIIDNRDNGFVADFGGGHKQEIWGYHGYWFKDFYKVDEHLGDMNTVKRLVSEAHKRGIKILLDIVANHTDYDHPFAKERSNPGSKYHSWFNKHGVIKDWNNQWWVENGELAELPDLDQNNPEVAKYVIDNMKWWITQTGVDGFRIDTVKHVPRSFWQKFNQEIRSFAGNDFLLLGEIYTGFPEFQAPYLKEGMHSAFDFPLYYAIKDALGGGQSMRRLGEIFDKDGVYPDASLLSPFVDNHDVPRFVHEASGDKRKKLMLSVAFIMSIRGLPMLYYGTEVGLPGGADPDNRRDMEFSRDNGMREYVKALTTIRKQNRALRRGRQLEMWKDEQVYGFSRLTEVANEEVMAFFNNSEQPQTRRVPIRAESPLKSSQAQMQNLLNPQERVQIQGGFIQVTVPPLSASIYRVASSR
jgi:alpha-amylase